MTVNLANLNKAIMEVKSQYGKGTIQTFEEKKDIEVIPTDIYEFDTASNIGGLPIGKIIEIAGPPSSGKTTLSWQILASIQRKTKKKILFLDYEQAADKPWLQKLNVPVEDVLFILPEEAENGLLSIEDGFEIMNKLLPSGAFCGVIWDSVAASNPKGLLTSVEDKGLEGRDIALTAAALTKGLAVYGPIYRKSLTNIIFVNHVRANLDNIANPFLAKFSDKEKTPGGNAFKHHADMRISLKPMDYVTKQVTNSEGKKVQMKIGQNIKIKFIKNRVGDPFGEEIILMRKGIGFDLVSSTIKRGIASGLIVRKTSGICYLKDDESFKAPSYESFWNLVAANPKFLNQLQAKLSGTAVVFDKGIDFGAAERDLNEAEVGEVIKDDEETQVSESLEDDGGVVLGSKADDAASLVSALMEETPTIPITPSAVSPSTEVPRKRGRPRKTV